MDSNYNRKACHYPKHGNINVREQITFILFVLCNVRQLFKRFIDKKKNNPKFLIDRPVNMFQNQTKQDWRTDGTDDIIMQEEDVFSCRDCITVNRGDDGVLRRVCW